MVGNLIPTFGLRLADGLLGVPEVIIDAGEGPAEPAGSLPDGVAPLIPSDIYYFFQASGSEPVKPRAAARDLMCALAALGLAACP
jgi:hypothetical protein